MTFPRACLLVAVLAFGGCQPRGADSWQGWIEADLLFIGPEDSGRLVELSPEEGRQVAKGDALFAIDAAVQAADVAAAGAALDQAVARLSRLDAAQQRPEEVAVLQATQKQATAALDLSTADLERTKGLAARGNASKQQLDQAQSNFDRDTANLENVTRQIEVARLSGRQEDIDAAKGVVDQARAQLASAQAKFERAKVAAPAAGRIEEIYYRPGEIVPPGKPVLSLLPPGNIKARFFVPEENLARMKIGGVVSISCDGCPAGQTARVSFIASQAEFTPPVIYSLDERRKLVFKVEARLDRPELFRVGQPISARPADEP